MVIQELVLLILGLLFDIVAWLFSFIPDIELSVGWIPFAKGLLDWASYFFPVYVLYEQATILFLLLDAYLIIKLISFVKNFK